MTDWQHYEREFVAIGFPAPDHVCRPAPRGPHQWRETVALARTRAAETGRRYRVWSYEVMTAEGPAGLVYGCGPYPLESLRATTPAGRSVPVPRDPADALIKAGQEIMNVVFNNG